MSANTKIEWARDTFNIVHGCAKISEGCKFCYAADHDARHLYTKVDHWGAHSPRMKLSASYWLEPYAWNKLAEKEGRKHTVFCSSMADVFEDHPDLPSEREKLWPMIEQTPNLFWLLLTKRPENVMKMVPDRWQRKFPDNIWMMATAENQARFEERFPVLKEIPASILGLSCEPLLSPINFGNAFAGIAPTRLWIIGGGESGSKLVRPTKYEWFTGLRDQCQERGIAFFFKQWGNHHEDGRYDRDKDYRLLDGREWNEYPPCNWHPKVS